MIETKEEHTLHSGVRRMLLKFGGLMAASQAIPLTSVLANQEEVEIDLEILNAALKLEHEAIAAYKKGAESGLLSGTSLELALNCQKDHKRHQEIITRLIKRFGGTAVEAKPHYNFEEIKTAEEILQLAHKLETEAVDTYLSNAGKLQSSIILDMAVSILVDEVSHETTIKLTLNQPVTDRKNY
jgi:hypothetical protein